MKKLILIFLFTLLLIFDINGQDKNSLEEMKVEFQAFNYSNVIAIAENLLQDKNRYNEEEQIEIYLLKGISHYSLKQLDDVKTSFFEILKLDSNYQIEPTKVSPKIISEFEKIYSDLAARHNLPLIPFFLEGIAENAELMQSDGIHPTAEGNRLAAANIMKAITPLLSKNATAVP